MLNSLLRGVGPPVYHSTLPASSLLVPAAALRAPGLRVLVRWATKKEVLNSLRGAMWTGPRGDKNHRSRRRRRHNGHHRITTASAAITTTVTTITTIIFIALGSGADGCS